MIDSDFNPFEFLELLSKVAGLVLDAESNDEATEKKQKISFDQRADEAISMPASPADRRSSARKAAALDKEFWESLG